MHIYYYNEIGNTNNKIKAMFLENNTISFHRKKINH